MTFEDLLQDEPYKSCYEKGLADGKAKGRADAIDEFVERITLPLTEEDIERIAKELKEQKNE